VVILPTKGIPPSKALITVGSEILEVLGPSSSLSMSGLWMQHTERRASSTLPQISYDWFTLAVDLLYALGVVELTELGLVRRTTP
jgi:hypothetical protein